MSITPWRAGDGNTIRPSLLHNGFLALGCLFLAVALFVAEDAKIEGAFFLAIFLIFSAGVIMMAHLPGSTGIWLDEDGFTARDMYKSERYRWSEVGPFMLRRKLLGKSIEFPYQPPGETRPQARSLPRGLGRSGWRLMRFMNERREAALAQGPRA